VKKSWSSDEAALGRLGYGDGPSDGRGGG
jgi:GTP-binding protein Era